MSLKKGIMFLRPMPMLVIPELASTPNFKRLLPFPYQFSRYAAYQNQKVWDGINFPILKQPLLWSGFRKIGVSGYIDGQYIGAPT
jgi:hypothetical protein